MFGYTETLCFRCKIASEPFIKCFIWKFGEYAGDQLLAGESFEIDQLVIEILRSIPFGRKNFIGIIKWRIGSGFLGATLEAGCGYEIKEARLIRSKRLRVGTQPQNLYFHGIALFDFRQQVHAAHHTSENIVLIIQPRLRTEHQTKLRPISIRPVIAHLQSAHGIVAQTRHDFVRKQISRIAHASSQRITALHHQTGHDPAPGQSIVEWRATFLLRPQQTFGQADMIDHCHGHLMIK
jgi:hypothetical protein